VTTTPPRPSEPQELLERIGRALAAGRTDEAMGLAGRAAAAGFRHPLVLHLAGDRERLAGRPQAALPLLQAAAGLAGREPTILLSLGLCLADLGRWREAVAQYDRALALQPGLPPALFAKGQACEQLADLDGAWRAYEAAALQPGYPEPLAGLAYIAVNSGRAQQARAFAERALAMAPDYEAARLTLASADLLDGRFTDAERALRDLLARESHGAGNRGTLLKLLGDALHGQGRFEAAAQAYADGAGLLKADYLRRNPRSEGLALQQARRLLAEMTDTHPGAWRRRPQDDEDRVGAELVDGHAFLVGFPRSGTTLLEKALARHERIVSLEERPTLAAPLDEVLTGRTSPAQLAAMSRNEADRQRSLYWSRIQSYLPAGDLAGKVLVDKMPLNVLLLPVISRLFPDARIIFAVRDPRDVVLSCFRQRFLMTAAMAEFSSLTQAARYYDAVMQLADVYRTVLPLAIHEHRYEAMVADFDASLLALLTFLDLPWRPEVREFGRETQESLVNTPSARQLAGGLNTKGLGQWRSYAGAMAEAGPLLQPWVERFGYGP
jgi:tetratricopeptide (TPR) repeat protein